jgi:hypothetical protein
MRTEQNALKQRLIMSVGTHRRSRPLSPVEAAEGLATLEAGGMPTQELARMLQLEGTSMLGRFARLRRLSSGVRHLVDWRGGKSAISFSAATEMARLSTADQDELARAVLEKSMTKSEVIQVVQLRQRSHRPLPECIEQVVRMRPRITYREVFIGAITDDAVRIRLGELTQAERDEMLVSALSAAISPAATWAGRLGKRLFTLVGGAQLAKELRVMAPNFEAAINELIAAESQR